MKFTQNPFPLWGTGLLLAAAIALMAFGVLRGEAQTVMEKAVNICLECIGIG